MLSFIDADRLSLLYLLWVSKIYVDVLEEKSGIAVIKKSEIFYDGSFIRAGTNQAWASQLFCCSYDALLQSHYFEFFIGFHEIFFYKRVKGFRNNI